MVDRTPIDHAITGIRAAAQAAEAALEAAYAASLAEARYQAERARRAALAPATSPTLTVPQAARYLNLPRDTIYALVHGGELPNLGQGRAFVLARHHLDAWVAAQPYRPHTPTPIRRVS